MNGLTLPIIRLEVQGMQHVVHVALLEHQAKIDEYVAAELDRMCKPENVNAIVYEAVQHAVRDVLKAEIEDFFRFGSGRIALRSAVRDSLSKIADEVDE